MSISTQKPHRSRQVYTTPGAGSRVAGRGSLLRTLRALIRRTGRFATVRATPDQQLWAAEFYDGLDAVFRRALTPDAAACLRAVDARRWISSKTAGRVTTDAGVLSDAG